MTIADYHQNVQTFLKYDFINGPSQGRYLKIVMDEKGCPILSEVSFGNLSFTEKLSFYMSDGKNLQTIVNYVGKKLLQEAQKVQHYCPDKWRMQFALLEKKVEKHNAKKWFSFIQFKNPFLEKLKIAVTIPRIPKSLDEEKSFKCINLSVPYSPLTTFEKVEEVIREQIGSEGFLVDGNESDRSMISGLAERKVTISSWIMENVNEKLKIVYVDINIKSYTAYVHEKGHIEGYYKGYANGLFNSAARTDKRHITGYHQLESARVKTKEELYEEYHQKKERKN